MRRQMGYGLMCGALLALLVLTVTGAAIARDCGVWYDARLCGQGSVEYEGAAMWDYEVLQSPISIADSPGRYSVGYFEADHNRANFWIRRGGEPSATGQYNEDIGCYTDWHPVDNPGATTFMCWDGEDTVRLWYGSLNWSGFGYEFGGGWLYRMDIVSVSSDTGKELRRFIPPRRGAARRGGGARVQP